MAAPAYSYPKLGASRTLVKESVKARPCDMHGE